MAINNGVEDSCRMSKRAWVTLLTNSSYTPGVITLSYTLQKHGSIYPLVVLITPTLDQASIHALLLEAKHTNLIIKPIQPLLLPNGKKGTIIAERFVDTWTKLRAFELFQYEICCFLDADITIYDKMDEIFDTSLPSKNWITAAACCVCNLDRDHWAPTSWKRDSCRYTPQQHPASLQSFTSPVPQRPPHPSALLNGGVFLYHPSRSLWKKMHHYFLTCPDLTSYQFPDQDFLAAFFHNKWLPLSWKYNALKTMQNWHTNIWRDEEVKALHYIVDKPWQRRLASDGIGGHLGRDGQTHAWWWDVHESWRRERAREPVLLGIVEDLVAKPLTPEEDAAQCRENQMKGFPVPLP